MKTEVYRSFEGKLSPECQRGYIIYDCGNYWEINHQTVWMDEKCYAVRINKGYKFDFDDIEKIEELAFGVNNGTVEGQAAYKGSIQWKPLIKSRSNITADKHLSRGRSL